MGKIMICHCKHSFQDETYGVGKRYFNTLGSGQKVTGYVCTVCGTKVTATSEDKKNEKETKKEGK